MKTLSESILEKDSTKTFIWLTGYNIYLAVADNIEEARTLITKKNILNAAENKEKVDKYREVSKGLKPSEIILTEEWKEYYKNTSYIGGKSVLTDEDIDYINTREPQIILNHKKEAFLINHYNE